VARGESAPPPRRPVGTDQGGLVMSRTIRTGPAPHAPDAGHNQVRTGSALTSAAIATVVGTAARAPSVHNTQPWIFRIIDDLIELHADPDRLLAQIDPVGRELTISCGAALFGLRLGLRQLGWVPAVQPWPDPTQPWLAARVWPDGQTAMNRIEAELIAAVPHRHTHRGPFTPGAVSTRLLAALAVDAAAEGAELRYLAQPDLVSELAGLVDLAAAAQEASPSVSAETRRWVRPLGSEARDGVPEQATAVGNEPSAQRFRQREFGATADGEANVGSQSDASDITGEPPAATAVLVTDGDAADDWLRAGQALNRLLLRAATRWVFASLQSQPMESPRYREQVRDLLALPGQPQMLLQFGRSNTALATPRRRQAEFRANENRARPLVCRHTGLSAWR
jgi:nitroreductase